MRVSITRRRLLAVGLGGTALLAGSGLLSVFGGDYDDAWAAGPARAVRPLALSIKEFVVVTAIVDALYPQSGGFPAGVEVGVPGRVDELVWAQPAHVREDLKAALQLIEHAPPLVGSLGRFSRLDVDERGTVLRRLLQRGPAVVVQAAVGLQQMASIAYFADERVWSATGYDGPWQQEPKPPASHAAYVAAQTARSQA